MRIEDIPLPRTTPIPLQETLEQMREVINSGQYEFSVATSIPSWTANEGEVILYTSGTIYRLYAYIDGAWRQLTWGATGGLMLSDADGDTSVQVEESVDDDTFRVDTAGTERMTISSTGQITVSSTANATNLNADLLDGYHYNETELKPLGSWASRNPDTVYQAATDGFVTAWVNGNSFDVKAYTDGSNPPTTVRTGNASGYYDAIGICMPVKKDDYYKVVFTQHGGSGGTQYMYWIPLGV